MILNGMQLDICNAVHVCSEEYVCIRTNVLYKLSRVAYNFETTLPRASVTDRCRVQNVIFRSIQDKCNVVSSRTHAAKSAIYLRIMCEESTTIKKETLQSLASKALYHSELPSQNRRSCGGMGSPSSGNKIWEKAELFELSRRKRIRQLGRRVNLHIIPNKQTTI